MKHMGLLRYVDTLVVLACLVAVFVAFDNGRADEPGASEMRVTLAGFEPDTLPVELGSTVTWIFDQTDKQSTVSAEGFWASGMRGAGEDYVLAFPDAGIYRFFDIAHRKLRGVVQVSPRAEGTPSTGYTLAWSTRLSTPPGRRYDVQMLAPGGTGWTPWRVNSVERTARFAPKARGTYQFRARTDNVVGKTSSGWSMPVTLQIS